MASGDPVLFILEALPPAADAATPDTRPGGSTPAETVSVWDFDASTIEYMDFKVYLSPKYGGGGLTLTLPWSASTATSGAVVWQAAIRRIADDAEDIDAAHTYDYNAASADTAPTASGEISYPTIAFTNGADMDSLAAGEYAILRVRRKTDDAGDDMTGDAELWDVQGKET